MEKAYHIFLQDKSNNENDEKLTKAEYLVYSHFMRFGCNIKKFREDKMPLPVDIEIDNNQNDECNDMRILSTSPTIPYHFYVWNYLYELLGHKKTIITTKNIDIDLSNEIKTSMNNTIESFRSNSIIANDSSDDVLLECDRELILQTNQTEKRKRTIDYDSNTQFSRKSAKLNHESEYNGQYFGSGSINDFMVGNEFEKFKHIFDKIDLIQLKGTDCYSNEKPNDFKFSFDLWTTKDTKQSQCFGPNYRIIIKYVCCVILYTKLLIRSYLKINELFFTGNHLRCYHITMKYLNYIAAKFIKPQ